jgi:hypothetical protein
VTTTDSEDQRATQIAAIETELTAARSMVEALGNQTPGTSSMRGKQHHIRIDANLRRLAQAVQRVQGLDRQLEALRRPARKADAVGVPATPENITKARFVHTWAGWHQVVKVNRVSVKVKAAPGMDDLVPFRRIDRVVFDAQ